MDGSCTNAMALHGACRAYQSPAVGCSNGPLPRYDEGPLAGTGAIPQTVPTPPAQQQTGMGTPLRTRFIYPTRGW